MLVAMCGVEGKGSSGMSASRGSSSSTKSKVSNVNSKYVPCLVVGSNFSVNMEIDPSRRCRSSCFTVVAVAVNSSDECARWSNYSVWEMDYCRIACDRMQGFNRSLPNGTCVVDEEALPIYPGIVNVSDNADIYAVPMACLNPPYEPPCQRVGLSVEANMHMKPRCFSKCYTVVAMWINTSGACLEWSNNTQWDDDRCRIGCEDLIMFNESLPNGTCVVNGSALPIFPGVANVSDDADLYSVPMECVEPTICKFSRLVWVSNDALCDYSEARFIMMIFSLVWLFVGAVFIALCRPYDERTDRVHWLSKWQILGLVCMVGVGFVWELGLLVCIIGCCVGFGVAAYTEIKTREAANYRPVEQTASVAAVTIDLSTLKRVQTTDVANPSVGVDDALDDPIHKRKSA